LKTAQKVADIQLKDIATKKAKLDAVHYDTVLKYEDLFIMYSISQAQKPYPNDSGEAFLDEKEVFPDAGNDELSSEIVDDESSSIGSLDEEKFPDLDDDAPPIPTANVSNPSTAVAPDSKPSVSKPGRKLCGAHIPVFSNVGTTRGLREGPSKPARGVSSGVAAEFKLEVQAKGQEEVGSSSAAGPSLPAQIAVAPAAKVEPPVVLQAKPVSFTVPGGLSEGFLEESEEADDSEELWCEVCKKKVSVTYSDDENEPPQREHNWPLHDMVFHALCPYCFEEVPGVFDDLTRKTIPTTSTRRCVSLDIEMHRDSRRHYHRTTHQPKRRDRTTNLPRRRIPTVHLLTYRTQTEVVITADIGESHQQGPHKSITNNARSIA
jgi:hypothetical protein